METIIKMFDMKKVNDESDFDIFVFETPNFVRPRYILVKKSLLRLKDSTYIDLKTDVSPFLLPKYIENNSYTKTEIKNLKTNSYKFSISKFKQELVKDGIIQECDLKNVRMNKESIIFEKNSGRIGVNSKIQLHSSIVIKFTLDCYDIKPDFKISFNNIIKYKELNKIVEYTIGYVKQYNDMVIKLVD